MYIKIRVQWTYNDIHNNHGRNRNIIQIIICKVLQIEMCLDSFSKSSKRNNIISKSSAFHSVGAAYINDRSTNKLAPF